MTAPTLGTRTAYASPAVDSASWTVFTGKSVARGSVLLVAAAADGNISLSTASSGWSKLGEGTVTGSVPKEAFAVFRKMVSDSGDFALSADDDGQYSALLVEVAAASTVSGTVANASNNPPNHNINTTRDVLWVAAISVPGTTVASGAPTNYSNLATAPAAGSNGASISAAFRTVSADSSENPGSFSGSLGGSNLSWTVAIYAGGGRRSGGFL